MFAKKMKNMFYRVLPAVMISLAVLAGCGTKETETEATVSEEIQSVETVESETAETTESEAEVVEEKSAVPDKDRCGNEIKVPEKVEKIVSMAPSTTQILIDLGYADQIIACDTYSAASYGSALKADIPQFDMMTPDNEQIAALEADIVFTTGMSYSKGENVYAAVKEIGVCVADIPSSSSLEEIKEDIRFIGACIGANDKAEEIVGKMEESIKEIQEITAKIPEEEKKTVLFELSTPTADYPEIYSCGYTTYIHEILTITGLKSVTGNEESTWISISEEAAIAANPDVILSADTYTPDVVNVILGTKGWENVNAVKNQEVYKIDGDTISRPNHHVIDVMYEIINLVYPEYLEEADEAA